MLEGLYKPKATSVRCNISKATVEEIVKSLEYQGTTVEKSKLYDKALKISGYDKLENLDVSQALRHLGEVNLPFRMKAQ